jgi:Leucine-rich repeat (LRR) protein
VTLAWLRVVVCVQAVALCGAASTEREIAEWAIRQGGRVMLDGSRTALEDVSQLPTGPIRISGLDLVGTIITPQDLARIRGLTDLRELYLPGPIWTPFSDSPLDANDELKNLAELKNLRRLSFSPHFLSTYNVQDKGLAHLTALTGIEELRLAQSQVVKPNLGAFAHLRAVDLSDSTFSDEGMKVLENLKELRRLYLRNTPVTDDGLQRLSGLTSLEELDLYGVRVTDRGIESLRTLTSMRKLNLLGAELSDASMDVVSGMTHLRELNLYRSHITNAGLAKLGALKELAALDVRYSRVTPTGV